MWHGYHRKTQRCPACEPRRLAHAEEPDDAQRTRLVYRKPAEYRLGRPGLLRAVAVVLISGVSAGRLVAQGVMPRGEARWAGVEVRPRDVMVAAGAVRAVGPGATAGDTTSRPRVSLFTRGDAYLGALFVLGTAAVAPADRYLAQQSQRPSLQGSRVLRHVTTDVTRIASPGSIVIGGMLYAVGRLGHSERVADLGLHGLEAIGVGSFITEVIKGTAGRARPYVTRDTNPHDFKLLRGFRKGTGYSSFPSGHSLAAFAAAAVVTDETRRWWPRSAWYVGPAMYGGAALAGLARMYNDKHWASDVIAGAAIGTFAGKKLARFQHRTNPGNRLDRWLLPVTLAPDGRGGVALVWGVGERE